MRVDAWYDGVALLDGAPRDASLRRARTFTNATKSLRDRISPMTSDPEKLPIDEDARKATKAKSSLPNEAESQSVSDPMENTAAFERVHEAADSGASPKISAVKSSDIPTTLGRFKINGVLGTGGIRYGLSRVRRPA